MTTYYVVVGRNNPTTPWWIPVTFDGINREAITTDSHVAVEWVADWRSKYSYEYAIVWVEESEL